jgi:hypothetical protein
VKNKKLNADDLMRLYDSSKIDEAGKFADVISEMLSDVKVQVEPINGYMCKVWINSTEIPWGAEFEFQQSGQDEITITLNMYNGNRVMLGYQRHPRDISKKVPMKKAEHDVKLALGEMLIKGKERICERTMK